MRQIARFAAMGMVAVAAIATLPAAVVESTDPDTGYKVLTVAEGEFAEYATVLDASVPGLIKRGAGTAWLTGANSAFVGPIQIEADTLDDKTYGAIKTVATFTNPIDPPSLTLVNANGTVWASNRQWCLVLADGGRTLKFGPLRGTQILLR